MLSSRTGNERVGKDLGKIGEKGEVQAMMSATISRQARVTALLGMSARDGQHAAPPIPSSFIHSC